MKDVRSRAFSRAQSFDAKETAEHLPITKSSSSTGIAARNNEHLPITKSLSSMGMAARNSGVLHPHRSNSVLQQSGVQCVVVA